MKYEVILRPKDGKTPKGVYELRLILEAESEWDAAAIALVKCETDIRLGVIAVIFLPTITP